MVYDEYKVDWPDNNDRAEGDHVYFEQWLNYQWGEGWELITYSPGGYIFKRIEQARLIDYNGRKIPRPRH